MTLERLLDAAQALIVERGSAEWSIPELVARAGSSVGGFYARFKDKDELVCALEERFLGDKRRMLDALTDAERIRDLSLCDLARQAIRKLVKIHRRNQQLAAAFVAASARDRNRGERTRAFRQEVIERFSRLLLARRDEIRHPDPERAVEVGIQMVLAGMRAEAVFGPTRAGGTTLSEDEMAAELERMFVSYLGITD